MTSRFNSPRASLRNGFSCESDSVLAGDRSAKGQRAIKNLLHGQFDPVHLVGILFVCQKGWMQIAIAHMFECANFLAGTFQQCAGCVPSSAPIHSAARWHLRGLSWERCVPARKMPRDEPWPIAGPLRLSGRSLRRERATRARFLPCGAIPLREPPDARLSQSHSNQKRPVFPQVPRSDAPGLGRVRRKDIFPENADVKRPDRLAAGNRQTGKIGIFFLLNGERTIWLGLDNLLHMRHERPNRQKRITPTGRKL